MKNLLQKLHKKLSVFREKLYIMFFCLIGLFWLLRGYILAILYILPSFRIGYYKKVRGVTFSKKDPKHFLETDYTFLRFNRFFYRTCFNKGFILSKCALVEHEIRPIATSLDGMVALAWLGEKMKVNIEIERPTCTVWRHFENNTLINTKDRSLEQRFNPLCRRYRRFPAGLAYYAIFSIPSEYGYKVLSKLSLKENIKASANQWFAEHIKRNWVAVHYRGTDVAERKRTDVNDRYRIELDSYITYLKGVLDEQSDIFACSDQVQFIDKMHVAFPGRVYARDIERSYDHKPLHLWGGKVSSLRHEQQEKDALIDLCILMKAKLIYTTGSGFVDIVRYFNPQIKIVSLDDRIIGMGKNNIPIPKRDLYDKLRRHD